MEREEGVLQVCMEGGVQAEGGGVQECICGEEGGTWRREYSKCVWWLVHTGDRCAERSKIKESR